MLILFKCKHSYHTKYVLFSWKLLMNVGLFVSWQSMPTYILFLWLNVYLPTHVLPWRYQATATGNSLTATTYPISSDRAQLNCASKTLHRKKKRKKINETQVNPKTLCRFKKEKKNYSTCSVGGGDYLIALGESEKKDYQLCRLSLLHSFIRLNHYSCNMEVKFHAAFKRKEVSACFAKNGVMVWINNCITCIELW